MRIAIAAAVACLSIIGVTATAQVHAAVRKHTEIPAEPLDLALRTLAKDRGFQVVYLTEDVRALQTRGAVGDFTVDEALKKLLSDSRLEYKFVDENTVSIFPKTIPTSALEERNGASARVTSEDSSGDSPKSSPERQLRLAQVDQGTVGPQAVGDDQNSEKKKQEQGLTEIVVTGTNIHGVTESASPIRTIDRAEIDSSGVTTIEGLFKSVPENVGGQDVDTYRAGVVFGQAGGGFNRGYASGVDLRGLGSDSTLVLLNGQRLPISSSGFTVDISTIPLGIIDHVDILKDGASSIYGSDAVAAVVNIVTLKSFTGALTNVTGGTVTDGGKRDLKIDQLLGTSWDTGNIFGSYTFNAQGALSTVDRPATATALPQNSIPPVVTNQLYLSLEQSLSSSLVAHLEVLGSNRRIIASDVEAQDAGAPDQEIYQDIIHVDDSQLVSNASLTYTLPAGWRAVLKGQYAVSTTKFNDIVVPQVNPNVAYEYRSQNTGGDLTADGPLFSLPGGPVRLAIGVSDRSERLDGVSLTDLSRNIKAGYGELLVPIVGKENAATGVQRLELTVSDRYDHYSDFGGTNNPKVGVLFAPHPDVDFRATYSTSFRAPLLAQIGRLKSDGADFLFPAPDAASPTGSSLQLLETGGGNPNLRPETAHSFTAGLDFHPVEIKGLDVSVDYFNIDFKDRIERPSASPFLAADPALYGAFITRDPSLAAVEAIINGPYFQNLVGAFNPADIVAIDDDRLSNAEAVKVNGIDFDAKYVQSLLRGAINYGLNASYLMKYQDTLLAGQAPIDRLNTPYYPTKLRLRGSIGWDSPTWSSTFFANYVNSYTNNQDPAAIVPIASWFTLDGQVSYLFQNANPALSGTRVSLSVQNIFNRQPPFVENIENTSGVGGIPAYNYDPVNASLLGRYISLQLGKRW